MIYDHILMTVGNTPVIELNVSELPNLRLFAKLEFFNPTGSVKDRAAAYVITKLLNNKEINQDTIIIESSSGNFGIALSAFCRLHGLKFTCVVDPCISPVNEMLIRAYGANIIKVTNPDENGGFLLTRIRRIQQLLAENKNSYWVNQYANPYNAEAYYTTLGNEICNDFDRLDYVFLGISSGGTITGVSRRLKEKFPEVKVIAVDIIGSVIFGHPPKKRYIPGIGSSMVPKILKDAYIHDVVMMDEVTTIKKCHELLSRFNIFAGGSSGSAFAGMQRYFQQHPLENLKEPAHVLTVFPDRGERYCNTVYNEEWYTHFEKNQDQMKEIGTK